MPTTRDYVEWRYLPSGRAKHAVSRPPHGPALCGAEPGLGGDWLGTGYQHEYDRVAALPECKRCAEKLEPFPAERQDW